MPEVKEQVPLVSEMSENLIGSEIIRIAGEINEKIKKGEKIFNLTIGDFAPSIFPIPIQLRDGIIEALKSGNTNYPPANGIPELRNAVSALLKRTQNLDYSPDNILIASGARPLIFGTYVTMLNPGDKVIFPIPSWNNNHYCHLTKTNSYIVETKPENNFMPVADEIKEYVHDASMIALCSPLNPTGTVFSKEGLGDICDLVVEENRRRKGHRKPLYILYDQIYSSLTFGEVKHYDPVSLRPELRDYTIFIDGISKSLAATGIRVGWSFGPPYVMERMKAFLSHVGTWAPKAEQVATAAFLKDEESYNAFTTEFRKKISDRLNALYAGFAELKKEGFNVEAISPQAAIYLTVKFGLQGMKTDSGEILRNTPDVTAYLLNEGHLGIVPFYAFGSPDESAWYRISVGTCQLEEIPQLFTHLRSALQRLTK